MDAPILSFLEAEDRSQKSGRVVIACLLQQDKFFRKSKDHVSDIFLLLGVTSLLEALAMNSLQTSILPAIERFNFRSRSSIVIIRYVYNK